MEISIAGLQYFWGFYQNFHFFSFLFLHYQATLAIPGGEKDTFCGSGGDHRGRRRTGNRAEPYIRLICCGIGHSTQTLWCGGRHVDVAFLATSGCHTAKSSTSWVHLYHHRVVTYDSIISGWQNYKECVVQCSDCMSNRQSSVGVLGANIGDQSRA